MAQIKFQFDSSPRKLASGRLSALVSFPAGTDRFALLNLELSESPMMTSDTPIATETRNVVLSDIREGVERLVGYVEAQARGHLSDMLAREIAVPMEDYSEEVTRHLVTIGKGIFWSAELHAKVKALVQEIAYEIGKEESCEKDHIEESPSQ